MMNSLPFEYKSHIIRYVLETEQSIEKLRFPEELEEYNYIIQCIKHSNLLWNIKWGVPNTTIPQKDIIRHLSIVGNIPKTCAEESKTEPSKEELTSQIISLGWPNLSQLDIFIRDTIDFTFIFSQIYKHVPQIKTFRVTIAMEDLDEIFKAMSSCNTRFNNLVLNVKHSSIIDILNVEYNKELYHSRETFYKSAFNYLVPCTRYLHRLELTTVFADAMFFKCLQSSSISLRELKVSVLSDAFSELRPGKTMNLEKLDMPRIKVVDADDRLNLKGSHFPILCSLVVEKIVDRDGNNIFPLGIFNGSFLERYEKLSCLKLPFIHDQLAKEISLSCRELVYLEARSQIFEYGIAYQTTADAGYGLHSSGFLDLVTSLENLRTILIGTLQGGSFYDIDEVVDSQSEWVCLYLEHLFVSNLHISIEKAGRFLMANQFLKELTIRISENESAEHMNAWPKELRHRHLYSLVIYNDSHSMKAAMVNTIISFLPRVKVVTIHRNAICNEEKEKLIAANPRIQFQ